LREDAIFCILSALVVSGAQGSKWQIILTSSHARLYPQFGDDIGKAGHRAAVVELINLDPLDLNTYSLAKQ